MNVLNLPRFLADHIDDPAIKPDFMRCLKDHLLSRLHHQDFDGDEEVFTPEERNELRLLNPNRIVESKILRINYTSYDIRRAHDCLRTDRSSFLMTLSREDDPNCHPFWYCQLLKAFLIDVSYSRGGISGPKETMEVLWVRWLGIDPDYKWGFRQCTLPKIGFVPEDGESPAFGFLDPSLVVRGCHLIPAFTDGRTEELLRGSMSVARLPGESDDWARYYVNIFADRDMFTRYAAIGVGHDTRYSHGLVDDQLTTDDEDDGIDSIEDTNSRHASQKDGKADEEVDEDEDDEDESGVSTSDSDTNDGYDDSDVDACF